MVRQVVLEHQEHRALVEQQVQVVHLERFRQEQHMLICIIVVTHYLFRILSTLQICGRLLELQIQLQMIMEVE